ncbi:hypothetical protein F5H01DRAFT_358765 [Linnemannia elongata]|nr:hypothetical protein F5H01DRAFT_358765 [Linnemannia elongata]
MKILSIALCALSVIVACVSAAQVRRRDGSPNAKIPIPKDNGLQIFDQATCDDTLARFNNQVQTCLDNNKALMQRKKRLRTVMSGPYNRLRRAVIDARIARYTTPTGENAHGALRELIRKYYKSFGSGNAGQDKPSTVMKHCEAARVSISEWFLHLCNTDAPK